LQLLHELGLYHTIFTDPSKDDFPKPELSRLPVSLGCLEGLKTNREVWPLYDVLIRSNEDEYLGWSLAAFSPWHGISDARFSNKKRGGATPLAVIAAREGIKATNKLCDLIAAAQLNYPEILGLKQAIATNKSPIPSRDIFGMAIRKWERDGGSWRVQVLYAILIEAKENLTCWPSPSR
jgi:tRNA nucleotidyltransferase (CCA-adding enzyme)